MRVDRDPINASARRLKDDAVTHLRLFWDPADVRVKMAGVDHNDRARIARNHGGGRDRRAHRWRGHRPWNQAAARNGHGGDAHLVQRIGLTTGVPNRN